MSIREMYEYAYYKIYKFLAFSDSWGADWRASGMLIAILNFIPLSLIFYSKIMFPDMKPLGLIWFLAPGGVWFVIDYFIVSSDDKWKGIIEKYDAWPRRKNLKGTFIVWGVIAVIVGNFLFATNLYSKI